MKREGRVGTNLPTLSFSPLQGIGSRHFENVVSRSRCLVSQCILSQNIDSGWCAKSFNSIETENERSLPILCLCLDRLTKIKATLGYRVGNLLLKTTADRLRCCIGERDKIAYLSYNRFVIVFF
ncbi:hypothetical protein NIES593_09445 [Hydrococcus rivularis NIES-593]|uniref:GGDEF domain-containing protein n=1 Tax=Hydrococcus rivularis NIES-593 TaxID=1921803 RepID=A0A1U7HIN1_9CYAN|nr:diguanylate cyclase [Hydrococcus rivularis]OKH23446.1 hypothetical protein NIES593_09445 [Hydrococcus rivularis NIES-593]